MKRGWLIGGTLVLLTLIILFIYFIPKETMTIVDIPAKQLPGIIKP